MPKLNKLHRSTNSSIISGVMGGIAEYYGWSPAMLRFILILVIVGSAGITFIGVLPIYILLIFLMPKATMESYGLSEERRNN